MSIKSTWRIGDMLRYAADYYEIDMQAADSGEAIKRRLRRGLVEIDAPRDGNGWYYLTASKAKRFVEIDMREYFFKNGYASKRMVEESRLEEQVDAAIEEKWESEEAEVPIVGGGVMKTRVRTGAYAKIQDAIFEMQSDDSGFTVALEEIERAAIVAMLGILVEEATGHRFDVQTFGSDYRALKKAESDSSILNDCPNEEAEMVSIILSGKLEDPRNYLVSRA